ncbi:MAG: energy-coupling factor transporter ATPase [Tissierellia bacterium]|nr:energy-coupling factor transporter ATPase [Tissierellia bacterium]
MIKIENVSFKYHSIDEENETLAVDSVSLNIERGEFLAVLGHNGSGKSTLASMINGLNLPLSGDIFVNEMNTKDEKHIWDIREKAGMVFQNPDNQIVATIVEEDVAFGPENLGVERTELRRRVDNALEVVGMTEYKDRAPHQLSGGQKQRVAIAGILAMNPDCIILDEPTAMLDPIGRREVIDTIKKLHSEENKTIVLITHYMDEVVDADRVVVMEKGKIALEGTPREVFANVEIMKKLGLDVPQVTELAHDLNLDGYNIKSDVLHIDELVDEICLLK